MHTMFLVPILFLFPALSVTSSPSIECAVSVLQDATNTEMQQQLDDQCGTCMMEFTNYNHTGPTRLMEIQSIDSKYFKVNTK